MKRICSMAATALATATVAAGYGFGLTAAGAHFQPPQIVPDLPGVGNPMGIKGPGPEVTVSGGRVWISRDNSIRIEVECVTSTQAGCDGALALTDAAGRRVTSAPFELPESQMQSVFLKLPAYAKRRVARPRGWSLTAAASASDSLGREDADSARVTVKAARTKAGP